RGRRARTLKPAAWSPQRDREHVVAGGEVVAGAPEPHLGARAERARAHPEELLHIEEERVLAQAGEDGYGTGAVDDGRRSRSARRRPECPRRPTRDAVADRRQLDRLRAVLVRRAELEPKQRVGLAGWGRVFVAHTRHVDVVLCARAEVVL